MFVPDELSGVPELAAFFRLSRDEQGNAIRTLKSLGFGEYTIAQATRWNVELVRRELAIKSANQPG